MAFMQSRFIPHGKHIDCSPAEESQQDGTRKTVDESFPELCAAVGTAQQPLLQSCSRTRLAKTEQPWALVSFIQLERRPCRPEFREIFGPRTFVSPRAHCYHSMKNSQKNDCVFLGPLTCHSSNEMLEKCYV